MFLSMSTPKSDFNPPNERSLAKTACCLSVNITKRCWGATASSRTTLRICCLPNLMTLWHFQCFVCLAIFCERQHEVIAQDEKFLQESVLWQKTFSRLSLFNAVYNAYLPFHHHKPLAEFPGKPYEVVVQEAQTHSAELHSLAGSLRRCLQRKLPAPS